MLDRANGRARVQLRTHYGQLCFNIQIQKCTTENSYQQSCIIWEVKLATILCYMWKFSLDKNFTNPMAATFVFRGTNFHQCGKHYHILYVIVNTQ